MSVHHHSAGESFSEDPFCFILPSAGFGVRMGTPESKEMLAVDGEDRPLIQFALDLFYNRPGHIVVPTRAEKKNLISFLRTHYPRVIVQIIEPSQEWPDTVLKSEKHWLKKNILVLPDTRWDPVDAVFQIMKDLDQREFSFSTFVAAQLEHWGVFSSEPLGVCDKPPQSVLHGSLANYFPWGHIAFQQQIGEHLFSKILLSQKSLQFENLDCSSFGEPTLLNYFKDLTRG
jgi:hypothetical protein